MKTSLESLKGREFGFTLVEMMIVVCIIGMMGAIAIPELRKARITAQSTAVINDFRILADAFNQYSIEHGTYPSQAWPAGTLPSGMEPYLDSVQDDWYAPPHCGGYWRWYGTWNSGKYTTLEIWDMPSRQVAERVDEGMDDGNSGSGKLYVQADQIWYFLEKHED